MTDAGRKRRKSSGRYKRTPTFHDPQAPAYPVVGGDAGPPQTDRHPSVCWSLSRPQVRREKEPGRKAPQSSSPAPSKVPLSERNNMLSLEERLTITERQRQR